MLKKSLQLLWSYLLLNYFCLISAHKYAQAIDLYTQAIELNGQNAVYWANRAFAHTKLEEYGSAIQDASKAIEIDPRYSKVGSTFKPYNTILCTFTIIFDHFLQIILFDRVIIGEVLLFLLWGNSKMHLKIFNRYVRLLSWSFDLCCYWKLWLTLICF